MLYTNTFFFFFFFFNYKLIVRHIFEHCHLQYLYRKPGWGQDNQQLPHKASILLQVLDWRVGNTTNKAHHHFWGFFFVFFHTIYLFLMSMCSLTILQHVFVAPLILFEL